MCAELRSTGPLPGQSPRPTLSIRAPRYATADFQAAFQRRALGRSLRGYSIEFPHDAKRLAWPQGFGNISTVLSFEVYRTGEPVDYACRETLHIGNCESKNPDSGPHNYRFYEEAAYTRWVGLPQ